MLKRFTVENFKGFQNKLTFDLTARDYEFNQGLVHDGVVTKAIIYGPNGIGKSSLGIALFDIVAHLTDKERIRAEYLANYRNLESNCKEIIFSYLFVFGKDEVPSSNLGSSSRETRCPARDSGFLLLSGGKATRQETHTETHTDKF